MNETLPKSEILFILEKLAPEQQVIMQALLYIFPELIAKDFLLENTGTTTKKELTKLIAITNASLKQLALPYIISETPSFVRLQREIPVEYYPEIWGAFSSTERLLLISIIAGEQQEKIEPSRLSYLNDRLRIMLIGKVHRAKGSYYLETTNPVNQEVLLESVKAFQDKHKADLSKQVTAYPQSDLPETE